MTENFYDTSIGLEPQINIDIPKIEIQNGNPKTIDKLEAIRQWILKFCMTTKDTYSIYEGTGFGNRIKTLYGKKRINLLNAYIPIC